VFANCSVLSGNFRVRFSGAISLHVIGLPSDDSLHRVFVSGGPGAQTVAYTTDEANYSFTWNESAMRKSPVFSWGVTSNPFSYSVDPAVVQVTGLCTMDRAANTLTYTP
jgi:hypothetical protein